MGEDYSCHGPETVEWKVWILVWEGGFSTGGCEVSKRTVGVALLLPFQNLTSIHCPIPEVEGRIQLLCICIIGPCFWGGSLVESPAVIDSRKEDTWNTLCSLPLGSYGVCPNHPCAHTCSLNSFPGFGKQSSLVPKCPPFSPRHSGLPIFWTFSSFFLFSSLAVCGNNIYIRHIW